MTAARPPRPILSPMTTESTDRPEADDDAHHEPAGDRRRLPATSRIALVSQRAGLLLMVDERDRRGGRRAVGRRSPVFLLVTMPLLWRRAAPLGGRRRRLAARLLHIALFGIDRPLRRGLPGLAFLLRRSPRAPSSTAREARSGSASPSTCVVAAARRHRRSTSPRFFVPMTVAVWGMGRVVRSRGRMVTRAADAHRGAARGARRARPAGGRDRPRAPLLRARRAAAPPPGRAGPAGRRGPRARRRRRRRHGDARRHRAREPRARSTRCGRSSACCARTARRADRARSRRSRALEALVLRAKGDGARLTRRGQPAGAPARRRAVRLPHRRAPARRRRGRARRRGAASASATTRSSSACPGRVGRGAPTRRSSAPASASSCTAARCGRRRAAAAPRPSSSSRWPRRPEVPRPPARILLGVALGALGALLGVLAGAHPLGIAAGIVARARRCRSRRRHPALAVGPAFAPRSLVTAPGSCSPFGAEALIGAHCFAAGRYSDRRGAVPGLGGARGLEPRAGRGRRDAGLVPVPPAGGTAWLAGSRGARARGRRRRAGRARPGARARSARPTPRSRSATSARGSPPSCTTSSPTRSASWSSRPAPASASRPPTRS